MIVSLLEKCHFPLELTCNILTCFGQLNAVEITRFLGKNLKATVRVNISTSDCCGSLHQSGSLTDQENQGLLTAVDRKGEQEINMH